MEDFFDLWGYLAVFTAVQSILPELEQKHNAENKEVKIEVGEYKGK